MPDAAYDIGIASTAFTIADNDGPNDTKTLRATPNALVKSGSAAGHNFGASIELGSKNNNANQTNVVTEVHSSGINTSTESGVESTGVNHYRVGDERRESLSSSAFRRRV